MIGEEIAAIRNNRSQRDLDLRIADRLHDFVSSVSEDRPESGSSYDGQKKLLDSPPDAQPTPNDTSQENLENNHCGPIIQETFALNNGEGEERGSRTQRRGTWKKRCQYRCCGLVNGEHRVVCFCIYCLAIHAERSCMDRSRRGDCCMAGSLGGGLASSKGTLGRDRKHCLRVEVLPHAGVSDVPRRF